MTPIRQYLIANSNGADKNKNVCALFAARLFRVHDRVRYLHTIDDLLRAIRKEYTTSTVTRKVRGKTVGSVRKTLSELSKQGHGKFWVVRVKGHVIVLDSKGRTIVDTCPVKRDTREITHCHGVISMRRDGRLFREYVKKHPEKFSGNRVR